MVGLESTIVTERGGEIVVLRKGGLAIEELEAVVGQVSVIDHSTSNPEAPGMLASHYATRTPIILGGDVDSLGLDDLSRVGKLAFTSIDERLPHHNQEVLSASGDLTEAASRLFASMRRLDALDLDVIVAELVPETGLGRAINDKLRRASV
jgi:L-threonylcarbamoyladenylate synthase